MEGGEQLVKLAPTLVLVGIWWIIGLIILFIDEDITHFLHHVAHFAQILRHDIDMEA